MKEMRLISWWSKRSFRKRKRKGLRQMFTYEMTLGELLPLEGSLANEIQLGWWQVPIRGSPSQFKELGIFLISDQGDSWIRIMSKWNRVSSIVFRTIEFLRTFCEKIFRFRTILILVVKIKESRLDLFYFSFHFYFLFNLFFYFLFLEQLGLGLISHTIISVTWWHSHKTDHKTWENLVEDSRTNDIIQHGHHMLASWTTHGCLG